MRLAIIGLSLDSKVMIRYFIRLLENHSFGLFAELVENNIAVLKIIV